MSDDRKNIEGVFDVTLDEKTYTAKCTFGLIELLERRVLQKDLFGILERALNGRVLISEMADTFYHAFEAYKPGQIKRDALGEAIMREGAMRVAIPYVAFLNYAVTGEIEVKAEVQEKDKKKAKRNL